MSLLKINAINKTLDEVGRVVGHVGYIISILNNVRRRLNTVINKTETVQRSTNTNQNNNWSNRKNNHVKWQLLSNIDCQIFTRLSKQQIETIASKYDIEAEYIWIALSICKSNLSYRTASSIFGYSPSMISVMFNCVFDTLLRKMVPEYLGSAWTRKKIQKHTPDFAKKY